MNFIFNHKREVATLNSLVPTVAQRATVTNPIVLMRPVPAP